MSFRCFQIREPRHSRNTYHTFTVVASGSFVLVMGNKMTCSSLETIAKPKLVLLNKREYFLVLDGILMSNNQELFIIFNQLCYIFSE